jgi:SAM-dependent methyltransferase
MTPSERKKQETFFDNPKHQYPLLLLAHMPYHTKQETMYLLNALRPYQGKPIVDFGAGSGRVTIPLLESRFPVIAVDISKKSLANLTDMANNLHLKGLTIRSELPKNPVDAIVGADVLHHIALEDFLPEFYQSLRPGGTVIFSEPCAYNLSWYIYLPLKASWDVEKGMMQCTMRNLERQFRKAGFSKLHIRGLGVLPRPLFNSIPPLCDLNDRLGNAPVFRHMAYRFIIQAWK